MKNLSTARISVLDLAMIVQGGSPSQAFENSGSLAISTENLGYTRYWLAEHHNMEGVASSATVVLIGHIASLTTSIRVGSGGIMLPNHSPLVVAEQFGTLGTLFPNRIDLGLGRAPGTDQLTARALHRNMGAVHDFPEAIRELQQYLSSDNRTSAVRAIPGEGLDIPIWVLGSSTDSAYVAASLGLPYAFASHFAPAMLHQALSIYRKNFKPSSQLAEPYVMACVNVVAADSDIEANRLATSFKTLFLGILTGRRQKLGPAVDPDGFMDPLEEEALLQMTRYSFIGGPGKVKMELDRFIEHTQADEIMITTSTFEHADRLRSYQIVADIKNSTSNF